MNLPLEQSLASCVRYVQDNDVEGIKLYFDEIPEKFGVPSIYFPVPQTSGKKVTLSSYCLTVTVNCWFMARTDWEANQRAVDMRDRLMLGNCAVPIVTLDGAVSEKCLRVSDPETRRIDEGIVQLSFSVKSYFAPGKETQKMETLYTAWRKVTRTFRE